MAGEHACAAPGCSKQCPSHILMCKPHWYQLPEAIRREVNASWRNVRRDPQEYRDAREKAVQWHRENGAADKQRSMF